jgi:acyl-CoA synthetase (AMP-forming)/AMP-acid ligase II
MNWVTERFRQFGERPVAINESGTVSYNEFTGKVERWSEAIAQWGIAAGERVALVADYHIDVVALLQALVERGCIVIPLSEDDRSLFEERLETVCATRLIAVAAEGEIVPDTTTCELLGSMAEAVHPLMAPLVDERRAGFVIFTSGSTGKGKAVLLD